jgi:hypothetical protein
VGRQEDRAAFAADLLHQVAEGARHQRIESRRRLVEDHQLWTGLERRDQTELLHVTSRVGPAPQRRVELEPLDQGGPRRRVCAPMEASEQLEVLLAGQVRPHDEVARDARQSAVELGHVAPRVLPQDRGAAACRLQEPHQQTDRRGLAGAVRPQEPEDLAGAHLEREIEERQGPSVTLGQPRREDRRIAHAGIVATSASVAGV